MATYTGKQMYQGQPGTSAGNLYQAPTTTGNIAIVRSIIVSNTTNSDAWISISLGTTGIDTAATRLMDTVNVPAPSTVSHGMVTWSGFLVLPASQFITGKQGTASALTVTISGVEVT